jgi:hypothetical protein
LRTGRQQDQSKAASRRLNLTFAIVVGKGRCRVCGSGFEVAIVSGVVAFQEQ